MEPTEDEIYSPEFEAIWSVMRKWDLWHEASGEIPAGYGGATGTDVMKILNALRDLKPKTQLLETKKEIKWERILLPLVAIDSWYIWRIWRNTRSTVH